MGPSRPQFSAYYDAGWRASRDGSGRIESFRGGQVLNNNGRKKGLCGPLLLLRTVRTRRNAWLSKWVVDEETAAW